MLHCPLCRLNVASLLNGLCFRCFEKQYKFKTKK